MPLQYFCCFLEYNFARGMPTAQSSDFVSDKARYGDRNAVDGIISDNRFSQTQELSDQWWRVNLQKTIIFQYARIYSRNGKCDSESCGKRIRKRLY